MSACVGQSLGRDYSFWIIFEAITLKNVVFIGQAKCQQIMAKHCHLLVLTTTCTLQKEMFFYY